MDLHPGTRPSRRPALQALFGQIGYAILEGRAPARPVAPWVSIPEPPSRIPHPASCILEGRAPAGPVARWVWIPGPGRHGGRPSRSCLTDWSPYPGGAGSRTPCRAMGLHPGTSIPHPASRILEGRAPARSVAPWVSIPEPPSRIPHPASRILEGRAPARPVARWVCIPGPGRHGGRPSRSCRAMGLHPGTRNSQPKARPDPKAPLQSPRN